MGHDRAHARVNYKFPKAAAAARWNHKFQMRGRLHSACDPSDRDALMNANWRFSGASRRGGFSCLPMHWPPLHQRRHCVACKFLSGNVIEWKTGKVLLWLEASRNCFLSHLIMFLFFFYLGIFITCLILKCVFILRINVMNLRNDIGKKYECIFDVVCF